MKLSVFSSWLLLISLLMTFSCAKEKARVPLQLTNEKLFEIVRHSAGSGYYQSGNILSPAGNSPHGSFKLRMNIIAQSVLNSSGELPSGSTFPDSSLIVKEIQIAAAAQYAVMYKNNKTWLWAEFKSDGFPVYSITAKGEACISCHSSSVNRDFTRTFDLH